MFESAGVEVLQAGNSANYWQGVLFLVSTGRLCS